MSSSSERLPNAETDSQHSIWEYLETEPYNVLDLAAINSYYHLQGMHGPKMIY
ncbi:UNVERIFIED_CONTAM: hypothetical protein FKN15_070055 [Acipenser sinensis]